MEPNETEGAVAISFVSADPPPGSRIAGCGANMDGCAGKIRMRFTALSPGTGFVQDVSAYLYGAERRIACLYSNDLASGIELRAGIPQSFEAIFGRSDDCPTPEKIRGQFDLERRRRYGIPSGLAPRVPSRALDLRR